MSGIMIIRHRFLGSLSIVGVNPKIKQNKRIEQAIAKKLSLV